MIDWICMADTEEYFNDDSGLAFDSVLCVMLHNECTCVDRPFQYEQASGILERIAYNVLWQRKKARFQQLV